MNRELYIQAVVFVVCGSRAGTELNMRRQRQTYFSSAVWAAMRVRSDLSARGQPDRLEDREREREGDCQETRDLNLN